MTFYFEALFDAASIWGRLDFEGGVLRDWHTCTIHSFNDSERVHTDMTLYHVARFQGWRWCGRISWCGEVSRKSVPTVYTSILLCLCRLIKYNLLRRVTVRTIMNPEHHHHSVTQVIPITKKVELLTWRNGWIRCYLICRYLQILRLIVQKLCMSR